MNTRFIIITALSLLVVGSVIRFSLFDNLEIELKEVFVFVKLYFYNPALDQGPGGVQCTEAGLVAVTRTIPKSDTLISDTIKFLLRGEITNEEKAQGITSEYPLEGLTLTGTSLKDETLTLSFDDPQGKTVGGACRVNILRLQIEKTAKQFPEVTNVVFTSEGLFQP